MIYKFNKMIYYLFGIGIICFIYWITIIDKAKQNNHSSIISNHFPDSEEGMKYLKQNYPLFEKAKYKKIILYPGDLLHIPRNYSHWCFSIGEPTKYNLNISINYWENCEKWEEYENFVNNEIKWRMQKDDLEYWSEKIVNNIIFDSIGNYPVIISKNKEITPIDKKDGTQKIEYLSVPEIFKYNEIEKQKDLKIALAQNQEILKNLGDFKLNVYPVNQENIFNNINFWMNFGDVNTGLHYDEYEGYLFQLIGMKIVYLFEPSQKKYLYFNQNFESL